MSGWLSAHYPMKALSQTHQLRVILCALLVLTVQSQDVVECGECGAKSSHVRLSHDV